MFLLRDGYDEVFSKFNFPVPPKSSPERSIRHDPKNAEDFALQDFSFDFMDTVLDFDSFFGSNLIDINFSASSDATADGQDEFDVFDNVHVLSALKEAISNSSESPSTLSQLPGDTMSNLDIVFDPANVIRSLRFFFECWHPNCRTIHRPTFSVSNRDMSLLASMILLGAMYVPDEEHRALVDAVARVIECYVFSQPLFDHTAGENLLDNDASFKTLQAGLMVIVAQFWAGDDISKRRVSTERFDQVTDVSSKFRLYNDFGLT